ncbi:LytTR family DNA-binding domain-containing protein [Shewanella sp. C32]|uniref:LytTR family DNA-binding domain-containing protein n=2 Tax=Shewanella electrica TaxID=515560 RepID=A0ABT2FK83_9GAMM|nr:LytTR family DNA-binding domain-containing protein [Shewanella electrica]MCH1924830.1 LytTR family DNA-binding domain-containing protein [Shewanella electrica]MCS4556723.1 LytTR family DNA-binding domain-containing protein [Shewanella electrica]
MKAIIVEDEPLAMEELLYIIQKHSQLDVVETFEDGLDAFKYLQTQQVDVVFLDINVPSIDGMLLARNIHQFAVKPRVVFTTAHKDFAAEAFEIEAFDYILKPFNEQRIKGVLSKLEALSAPAPASPATEPTPAAPKAPTSSSNPKVNLTKGERIFVTDVSAIYYVAADEKLTHVYTKDDEFVLNMTISEFIDKLPEEQFFRSHRSYCINLNKVQEIIPWYNSTYLVKLFDVDTQIPVSRSRIKAFRELMQL